MQILCVFLHLLWASEVHELRLKVARSLRDLNFVWCVFHFSRSPFMNHLIDCKIASPTISVVCRDQRSTLADNTFHRV